MADRHDLGKSCEIRAARLLEEKGFRVIARNYRWKGGEIDLIAEVERVAGASRGEKRIELVFVEVRARQSESWTSGLESVTYPKQRKLARTIAKYLVSYRGRATSVRCDVVDWNGTRFAHYEDAWRL